MPKKREDKHRLVSNEELLGELIKSYGKKGFTELEAAALLRSLELEKIGLLRRAGRNGEGHLLFQATDDLPKWPKIVRFAEEHHEDFGNTIVEPASSDESAIVVTEEEWLPEARLSFPEGFTEFEAHVLICLLQLEKAGEARRSVEIIAGS